MAISYFQQPTSTTIQASDNPIIFVWEGSNYLQPNFSFIVQTIIDGIVVSTDMVFPERGDRAHFDISKTTLAQFRATARTTAFTTLQNFSTARIQVAERFGTTPVTGSFTSSNTFRVMKARCDDEVFEANWITINYPASSKWLTDVPENTYIVSKTNTSWFSILNDDPTITVGLTFYDANDNAIILHSEAPVAAADRVNFCISETSLGPILSLYPLYTWADIFMIEVQMNAADPMFVRFTDSDCELNQQVIWLNKLGTYDQMLFSHNREVQRQITSREYKKQFGGWTANGLSFTHDPLTSGDTTYVREIAPTGSLYTGWIAESYRNWINTIAESVDVVLMVDGNTEKITPTLGKTEDLKTKFEELLNYQLDYKKTNYKSITQ